MSFWKTLASGLTLGALALVLTAGVEAGPRRGQRPGPDGPPPGRMLAGLELLDLSTDQEAAVSDLVQQHNKMLQPLLEQQRERQRQIEELAAAPDANPTQIGQLVIEAHAARKQVHAAMEKLRESVGTILTPEQHALWSRIEAAHKKARNRGRGRGEGFGPGFGPGPHEGFGPGPRGGHFAPGEGSVE